MLEMPEMLTYYTADEVAECLLSKKNSGANYEPLYKKLWSFVNDAKNPTPVGGDGTDGTVESPDDRMGSGNDDKTPHWWAKLTPEEQTALTADAQDF